MTVHHPYHHPYRHFTTRQRVDKAVHTHTLERLVLGITIDGELNAEEVADNRKSDSSSSHGLLSNITLREEPADRANARPPGTIAPILSRFAHDPISFTSIKATTR